MNIKNVLIAITSILFLSIGADKFLIVVHLTHGTSDIGGAGFMAVLLGVLVWNPSFINSKEAGM